MKISVYTILYYDLQFYEDIIKYIYDFVDEIIIIDGPYSYSIETLKKYNLYYDENNKPSEIQNIIKKFSKIKYKYVICDTEEEKRMIGYNACSNDLVLLIDSDEFLIIDKQKINNFIINTNKFVCCSDIYNMCGYNINYNKLTQKYILFKKSKITALEHLNYTWLIGCKQTEKNVGYMSFLPFGKIYHQTLNRNKNNNIVKFIFYVMLSKKINNIPFSLIDNYEDDYLINVLKLNVCEVLDIFVHSHINRINIPAAEINNNLELNNDEFIVNLNNYKNNSDDFYFQKEMKCLKNVCVCFRLNDVNKITVIFENVKSINVKIYNICLNKQYDIKNYIFQNVIDDKIIIENNGHKNYITVIEFNCSETKSNSSLFVIKNILNS